MTIVDPIIPECIHYQLFLSIDALYMMAQSARITLGGAGCELGERGDALTSKGVLAMAAHTVHDVQRQNA